MQPSCEIPKQERSHPECGGVAEGRKLERIVAARQPQNLAFHSRLSHFADDLFGKLRPECGVIARAHHEHFLPASPHARNIRKRADGRPEAPQFVRRDTVAQTFPNMRRIHSRAYYVRKVCGDVQEDSRTYQRLMRHSNESHSRADTRAHQPEFSVALAREPLQA